MNKNDIAGLFNNCVGKFFIRYPEWYKNNKVIIPKKIDWGMIDAVYIPRIIISAIYADKLQELLDTGITVNAKGQAGNTVLTIAALYNNVKAVELLVKANLDINAQNYNGNTALIIAADSGNIDIVNLLICANADLNIKNNLGKTVLEVAGKRGWLNIVELLTNFSTGTGA